MKAGIQWMNTACKGTVLFKSAGFNRLCRPGCAKGLLHFRYLVAMRFD